MTSEEPRRRIEVTPHGPYEVSGDIPIRPKTIVRSVDGRAMTWKIHNELDHPPTYLLCRCGQSRDKPFCDGSHAFGLFDGTESASTNTTADRAEVHDGPGLKVFKDGELCQHAGFCTTVATNWFEMVPRTDDHEIKVQLMGMIEHCPSGALTYELDGERLEPDLPVVIAPVTDGPLFVSGGVYVERADGQPVEIRNRMTLCRCGGSSNKPFCDGTHYENGFEAPPDAD